MTYKALVTGGTRGIGLAIAKRFLSDGLEVIITGRNNKNPLKGSSFIKVDFENDEKLPEFLDFLDKCNVDILVNNAGINVIDPFVEIKEEDFIKIDKVNLKVPFLISQRVIPHMKKNGWGRIVNITSIFSHITKEHRASYSASKFGLNGMSAAMAVEYASQGILVNSVGPGFIETDMTRNILGEEGMITLQDSIPMKRMGQPSEIAPLVSFLVSEENTYLTGQNIIIDGGYSRV